MNAWHFDNAISVFVPVSRLVIIKVYFSFKSFDKIFDNVRSSLSEKQVGFRKHVPMVPSKTEQAFFVECDDDDVDVLLPKILIAFSVCFCRQTGRSVLNLTIWSSVQFLSVSKTLIALNCMLFDVFVKFPSGTFGQKLRTKLRVSVSISSFVTLNPLDDLRFFDNIPAVISFLIRASVSFLAF